MTITQQAKEQVFAQDGGGFLALLTITHPDLIDPIRVVDNTENVWKRLPPRTRAESYTFARSTPKRFNDLTGVYQTFAADVLAETDRGISLEPAASNSFLNSNNFASEFSTNVNCTVTNNQTNPAGDANLATTVTDTVSGAGGDRRQRNLALTPGDVETRTFSLFVKKTVSATLFPSIQLQYTVGGTTVTAGMVLNTLTGAFIPVNGNTSVQSVTDEGAFWRVAVSLTGDGSANTIIASMIYPAFNTALSTSNQAGVNTGSQVVAWAQLEFGTKPTTPIITPTDVVSTRGGDFMTLHFPSAGTFDVVFTFDDMTTQTFANEPAGDWIVPVDLLNRSVVRRIEIRHPRNGAVGGFWDFIDDEFEIDEYEYTAYPFRLKLPEDRSSAAPRATLTIDNVSREIAQIIRTITTPPTVQIEVIRIDTFTSEIVLPAFKLRNVKWDALQLSGDLTMDDITREPFPQRTFTPSEYPGVFSA